MRISRLRRPQAAQPHKRKIVIAGNHELPLHPPSFARTAEEWDVDESERTPATCEAARALLASVPNCEYLFESGTEVGGGSGGSGGGGGGCGGGGGGGGGGDGGGGGGGGGGGVRVWGAPWQPVFGGAFNLARGPPLAARWALIPDGVDVLLTHGPPLGHGDLLKTGRRREGCLDLLEAVSTRLWPPRYHVFGHIHEGHGVSTDGATVFLNASSCTRRGQCSNKPLVFDVLPRGG